MMRKKQKKTNSTVHYVLNIYAGNQAKKHASDDSEFIIKKIKAHHNRRNGDSYYVLTVYKKGKPIRKHKSSNSAYIIMKVKQ